MDTEVLGQNETIEVFLDGVPLILTGMIEDFTDELDMQTNVRNALGVSHRITRQAFLGWKGTFSVTVGREQWDELVSSYAVALQAHVKPDVTIQRRTYHPASGRYITYTYERCALTGLSRASAPVDAAKHSVTWTSDSPRRET